MSRVHVERNLGEITPNQNRNHAYGGPMYSQQQQQQHQQPIVMQPMGLNQGRFSPPGFEHRNNSYGQNNSHQMSQGRFSPPGFENRNNSYGQNDSHQMSQGHGKQIQRQQSLQRSQMPVQVQQNQYLPPYQQHPQNQNHGFNGNSPPSITMQPGSGSGGGGGYSRAETSFSIPQQVNSYTLANVPSGLEYLASIDRIFVRQKIELLEAIFGCETKNKYQIYDSFGHEIFYAKEDTSFCTRYCLGTIRPFDMIITDGYGQEVIHLTRPLACGSCCFPCCLQSLEVYAPPGNFVGSIEQEWTMCIPKFRVKDAQGQTVLRIKGPCLTISCCNDVEFNVLSLDQSVEVGKISKQWSGLTREFFTDADNFGLSFPLDLDVKMKAVMIGACMLIDFMYFEHSED